MATVLKPCALLEQNLSFQAAEAQFAKRKAPHDAAKMQTLGMVSSDDIYSNVALLLSEQCPSITIKAATFAGVDRRAYSKIDVSLPVRCFSRWRICMPISICTIKPRPHLRDYTELIPKIIQRTR